MYSNQEKKFQEIYKKEILGANPVGDKGLYKKDTQIKSIEEAYKKVREDSKQTDKFTKEM